MADVLIQILPPNGEQGSLLTIHRDGKVTFGPEFTTADDASRRFWRVLSEVAAAIDDERTAEARRSQAALAPLPFRRTPGGSLEVLHRDVWTHVPSTAAEHISELVDCLMSYVAGECRAGLGVVPVDIRERALLAVRGFPVS